MFGSTLALAAIHNEVQLQYDCSRRGYCESCDDIVYARFYAWLKRQEWQQAMKRFTE